MRNKFEREAPAVEYIDRLRMAAMKAVTEDDMREIFQGVVKRAKQGDASAIKLLMAYLQPPPPAAEKQLPAQSIKAQTVNVYAGPRRKKSKLLRDEINLPKDGPRLLANGG